MKFHGEMDFSWRKWETLNVTDRLIDPVYDVVKLRYLSEKGTSYDFCYPKERWISTLKKQFPGEEEAIDK